MFKSARLKLTLWYFLTIFFVLLLFSALIYRVGSILLFENLNRMHLHFKTQNLGVAMPPKPPMNPQEVSLTVFNLDEQTLLEDFKEAKHRFLLSLIGIDAGVLLLTTFLAYILAGKTLYPIEKSLIVQKRFTTDAAHELRTPLTAIKTSLEVALKNKKITKKEAQQILQANLQDIESLEKLSNELLILAKTENNHLSLLKQNIALDELANELIHKFSALAKNKNIEIMSQAKHELIKTDHDKLIQLLSILLDNAIKYTKKNGKVTLNFFIEKNKAIFQVKDNGIGISQENLPLIFDRFYQAESARTKNNSNSFGLGLAIAKEISKQLNAQLTVSSKVAKSTTFTLTLC
jgi:hypothetical protein